MTDIKDKLSEKFETAIVSRQKLKTAEDLLKGQLIDCWDEKMVYDITRGVPKENLEEFAQCIAESLGLDKDHTKELEKNMKVMKFAETKNHLVTEMSFTIDEFKSVYGFFLMIREEDNTIAIAYAFHKLNFKMAPKVITELKKSPRRRRFLFCELKPEVTTWTRRERVKFGEKDINGIADTFGRHRALETLRREGVINAIKYED